MDLRIKYDNLKIQRIIKVENNATHLLNSYEYNYVINNEYVKNNFIVVVTRNYNCTYFYNVKLIKK